MPSPSSYQPRPAPPQEEQQVRDLVDWTRDELLTLYSVIINFNVLQVDVLHAPPVRPREGMIAYADGTDWDPGSGEGLYVYDGDDWVSATSGGAIPQNSQSANYILVAADAQKHIYHPSTDNNPRTFTIPANASVAFPIGTAVTFVNEVNTVTIAITSDTLVLAGTGSTGSRTLAAFGIATALKVTSTRWWISGTGIT